MPTTNVNDGILLDHIVVAGPPVGTIYGDVNHGGEMVSELDDVDITHATANVAVGDTMSVGGSHFAIVTGFNITAEVTLASGVTVTATATIFTGIGAGAGGVPASVLMFHDGVDLPNINTVEITAVSPLPFFGVPITNFDGNEEVTLLCFASECTLETPTGAKSAGDLRVGDFVCVSGEVPQPIRWIGRMSVRGYGPDAPVLIRKGTLGNSSDVRVSPQHCVVLSGWQLELSVGENEVLVPAVSLVNGTTISRMPCENIEYVHIMLDQHQVVVAGGGLECESFYPGDWAMRNIKKRDKERMLECFPKLQKGWAMYGKTVRPVLTRTEAERILGLWPDLGGATEPNVLIGAQHANSDFTLQE